jgi:hypothetical protein
VRVYAILLLRALSLFLQNLNATFCRAGIKASDSGKVTLSLDHVLDALKDAGFEDMVSAVALQVNGKIPCTQQSHLLRTCTIDPF